jgi:hypothetical protein
MQPQPYWAADPILLAVGEISVTRDAVLLPQGRYPLRGCSWNVQDHTVVTREIPTWAIVLAVVLIWMCLLSLLFLLVKEERYAGSVVVSVTGPGFYDAVQLPPGPQSAGWAHQQVNQLRAITAAA